VIFVKIDLIKSLDWISVNKSDEWETFFNISAFPDAVKDFFTYFFVTVIDVVFPFPSVTVPFTKDFNVSLTLFILLTYSSFFLTWTFFFWFSNCAFLKAFYFFRFYLFAIRSYLIRWFFSWLNLSLSYLSFLLS